MLLTYDSGPSVSWRHPTSKDRDKARGKNHLVERGDGDGDDCNDADDVVNEEEDGHLDDLLLAAELVDEHILPVVNFCQGHVQLPVHLVTNMILMMTRSMIKSKCYDDRLFSDLCVDVVWKEFVKALLHNLVHLIKMNICIFLEI